VTGSPGPDGAPARGAGVDRVRLYEDLAALTDEICAEVRAGHSGRVEELVARREALLAAIDRLDAGADGPGQPSEAERERSVAALTRALARDRELVALLQAEQARLDRALGRLVESRRLLAAYRGPGHATPAFVDRLG
jgi:hypothetical protein